MNTYTATLPNETTLTRRSTKALTHVVIAINERPDARTFKTWRALSWEPSEERARKVASNKLKNDTFGDYSRVEVIPCTMPPAKEQAAVVTTCQICGRPIKRIEINGQQVIALHGYKRPAVGFQTSSCRGARHLPYEQACDALQPEIDKATAWITARGAYLKSIQADPPAQVTREVYKGHGKSERLPIDRPKSFDPAKNLDQYNGHAYGFWYKHLLRRVNRDIDETEKTRGYLVARLAGWKAPQAE